MQDFGHELRVRGIALKVTGQPVNNSTAADKAFSEMLVVFAEFKTGLRRERQMEGIAASGTRGVCKGCKAKIKPEGGAKAAQGGKAQPRRPRKAPRDRKVLGDRSLESTRSTSRAPSP
ncbi:recombinase family protein [Paracoccus sp. (in: a-proteobacteria)]|uniref:recombinase family protein n=1 Tax=Paracoccus sp. TaxID=267 RepID=UPI0034CECCE4